MRRLLLPVILLAVLLIGADRVAQAYAQHRVAVTARESEHLSSTPTVHIRGFPFLTQLFGGRYRNVEVVVDDLRRGSLAVRTVDVHLRNADVPFGDVITGSVDSVPVERVDGTVVVGYGDMTSAARNGLTLSYAGDDTVRTAGAITVGGVHFDVTTTGRVALSGNVLRVSVDSASVNGQSAPAAVAAVARRTFAFAVRLPTLPFGIELSSIKLSKAGVVITATGHHLTLRALG
jgi:hypothetical protein